jgi:hypothetical protein
MRLKEEQVGRLAETILGKLTASGLVILKKERGLLLLGIRDAITADLKGEENLERDAEKLLDQTLAAMGSNADIDRHRMLKMIKDKLAKDRKIVL